MYTTSWSAIETEGCGYRGFQFLSIEGGDCYGLYLSKQQAVHRETWFTLC